MAMEQEMLQTPIRASGSQCDPLLHKKVEHDKER